MKSRERFLNACRGGTVDRPPVWLMRQAGRYLPEYQALRKRHSFMDLATDPQLIREVSLQPWRRFGMDGVIVFSDILIPAAAMGMKLSFVEGKGPVFDRYVNSTGDVESLHRPCVRDDLFYTLEGLRMLRDEIRDEAAIIGFVGGPLTIANYMVDLNKQQRGGETSALVQRGRARNPAAALQSTSIHLIHKLTDLLVEYAAEQVIAGADVIQIFESWAGLLEPDVYAEHVLPMVKQIIGAIKDAGAAAALYLRHDINERGAAGVSEHGPAGPAQGTPRPRPLVCTFLESNADVASIDSSFIIDDAFRSLGGRMAIQGNLDPQIMLGSVDDVRDETRRLIDHVDGRPGWIANLGHGVLPGTPVENVKTFIDTIKDAH